MVALWVLTTKAATCAAAAAATAIVMTSCGGQPASSASTPSDRPATTQSADAGMTDVNSSCPSSGAVTVSSGRDLKRALSGATPGQVIVLAPGQYGGHFTVSRSGTASAPITLCGPRSAVLDGGGTDAGYTLHLNHASWWRIEGFTVQNGQKGVVTDGASHNLITGLYVHQIGDEAIHLRSLSSDNTVSHNLVRDTGLLSSFFGEGIYVGSAHKNWCKYSGCQPDRCDRNVIAGNDIASTTAENIDIKEGTTGGKIIGNRLNGTGMDQSSSTAWINVKGNNWLIQGNTGTDSVQDGMQVHQVYPGWGMDNVFRGNTLRVNGPGYGIYVHHKRLRTIVACNNVVSGAGRGFSNVACTRG
ncbi:MAG TPA: right-handed parallel beta-helix repeat-containing protein [Streptosporangiaceae bacterium]|nr:right-handed parallel beta-helix repeat-containing protein [Streptosporangiaceae bacterium]